MNVVGFIFTNEFSRALQKLFQDAQLIISRCFVLFSYDVLLKRVLEMNGSAIERSKYILLSWRKFNGWNKTVDKLRKYVLRCLTK